MVSNHYQWYERPFSRPREGFFGSRAGLPPNDAPMLKRETSFNEKRAPALLPPSATGLSAAGPSKRGGTRARATTTVPAGRRSIDNMDEEMTDNPFIRDYWMTHGRPFWDIDNVADVPVSTGRSTKPWTGFPGTQLWKDLKMGEELERKEKAREEAKKKKMEEAKESDSEAKMTKTEKKTGSEEGWETEDEDVGVHSDEGE